MTPARASLSAAFFGALLLLIGLNGLLFAVKAVNPLIASDAWNSVDILLRSVHAGEFHIGDLFLKRAGFDHSQPLRKLILLFHYRFFDLDYSVEAVIALVAAFLNLAILWWMLARVDGPRAAPGALRMLVFTALAAIYLSLNSPIVFSWSLVTLNYTTHTFILLFFGCAWWALQDKGWGRLLAVLAAALAMDIVGDDTGLIATLAAVVPIALATYRSGNLRRGGEVCAAAFLAYLLYKAGYAMLTPATIAGGSAASIGEALRDLGQGLGDAWKWLAIPLGSSLVHRAQLHAWLGPNTAGAEMGIAALVAAGHAWFWWRALRHRMGLAGFVATALMMLFYGLVGGMVIARVSVQGADYLWQPRYTLIYEWNLVALLLLALDQIGFSASKRSDSVHAGVPRERAAGIVVATVATALLLLQVPLSLGSWHGVRYLSAYQQRMALQMGELARDPMHLPAKCTPTLVICRYPPARRQQVMQFLRVNRLNVFSPAFQARNRLYPDPSAMPQ